MYIIVAGVGQVGLQVVETLLEEGHSLAVIEKDEERVRLVENMDLLSIRGNAASLKTQVEAGVVSADLFIAATGSDEVNIIANWTDRIEEGRDETSGTAVTFTNGFYETPGIQVTAAENISAGDYFLFTSKSADGFTVQFYDSGNNPVNDRKYDWIAKGFGRKYTIDDIA